MLWLLDFVVWIGFLLIKKLKWSCLAMTLLIVAPFGGKRLENEPQIWSNFDCKEGELLTFCLGHLFVPNCGRLNVLKHH